MPSSWRLEGGTITHQAPELQPPPIIDDDLTPAVRGHYRHRKWPPKSCSARSTPPLQHEQTDFYKDKDKDKDLNVHVLNLLAEYSI